MFIFALSPIALETLTSIAVHTVAKIISSDD